MSMFFLKELDSEILINTDIKIPDRLNGKSYNEVTHYIMTNTYQYHNINRRNDDKTIHNTN